MGDLAHGDHVGHGRAEAEEHDVHLHEERVAGAVGALRDLLARKRAKRVAKGK